jgi:hypothetical protein
LVFRKSWRMWDERNQFATPGEYDNASHRIYVRERELISQVLLHFPSYFISLLFLLLFLCVSHLCFVSCIFRRCGGIHTRAAFPPSPLFSHFLASITWHPHLLSFTSRTRSLPLHTCTYTSEIQHGVRGCMPGSLKA